MAEGFEAHLRFNPRLSSCRLWTEENSKLVIFWNVCVQSVQVRRYINAVCVVVTQPVGASLLESADASPMKIPVPETPPGQRLPVLCRSPS